MKLSPLCQYPISLNINPSSSTDKRAADNLKFQISNFLHSHNIFVDFITYGVDIQLGKKNLI